MESYDNGPLFFFHESKENGHFSQWYPSPFTAVVDGKVHNYHTAEQYMMHHKALLGAPTPDSQKIKEILLSKSPTDCKALGSHVRNFFPALWDQHKFGIVVEASYLKFSSTPEFKTLILSTGERELVEASHFDRVWGVGFTPEQCKKGKKAGADREMWGQNLLGKALMAARERIRGEENGGEEEAI